MSDVIFDSSESSRDMNEASLQAFEQKVEDGSIESDKAKVYQLIRDLGPIRSKEIIQHGTEKQKDQLDEAIREAGTQPLGGPSTEDMMRCSHEVQGISHGITEEDLKFVSRDEKEQLLKEEIRTRWKLINGLKYEIKELKGLQK